MNRIKPVARRKNAKARAADGSSRPNDESRTFYEISQIILESADLNVMMAGILSKALEKDGFDVDHHPESRHGL